MRKSTGTSFSTKKWLSRSLGVCIGMVADRILADPPNALHPTAWFGQWASWLEKKLYCDCVTRGGVYTGAAVIPPVVALARLSAILRAPVVTGAVTVFAVVGAERLAREGEIMAARLDAGDLDGARAQLQNLCGRLPDGMSAEDLARATVESLAENTADSAVASIFWQMLAGNAGAACHRCINTLDAMVGYHNDRYERFGKVSAQLDDVMDWIPARISGALACLLAWTVGGSTSKAWALMCRDAHKHPSPNGGWPESAFAGALGVQLGGTNVYPHGVVEHRNTLGDGPRPGSVQVRRAARLVRLVSYTAASVPLLASLANLGIRSLKSATCRRKGA